jgi:hypothetical protein
VRTAIRASADTGSLVTVSNFVNQFCGCSCLHVHAQGSSTLRLVFVRPASFSNCQACCPCIGQLGVAPRHFYQQLSVQW